MISDYFNDTKVASRKYSNYRLNGNSPSQSLMTPTNNQSEIKSQNNEYYHNSYLGYQNSIGYPNGKKNSKNIISIGSKDSQIADSQDIKSKHKINKAQQYTKLSHLSVQNRTPYTSANRKKRNGSLEQNKNIKYSSNMNTTSQQNINRITNYHHNNAQTQNKNFQQNLNRRSSQDQNNNSSSQNLNKSSSQIQNDNDSVLNESYIKKQINLIKDFGKLSSFNQKDSDLTLTNRSRTSIKNYQTNKNSKQSKQDINKIFNMLLDVFDKEQINQTILKTKDPKERQKIIDRIIKRREEIKDAKQIVQISQCAQLINRFMKKIKKKDDDSNINNNNNNNMNTSFNLGQNSQNKLDSIDKTSANTNEILSFSSMHQKFQQSGLLPLSEVKEIGNSQEINKQDTMILQQYNKSTSILLQSPRQLNESTSDNKKAEIIKKGIALSFFFKQKVDQPNALQTMGSLKPKENQVPQSEDINSARYEKQNSNLDTSINRENTERANNNNIYNKLISKDKRKLSLMTKDNFFKNKQLPSTIEPGSTEARLYQINLNNISEHSKLLYENGQSRNRQKANELLKDFQKLNLASHFKSKSLNQSNFNNSEINTFNYKRVINQKKAESKIQILTPSQKEYVKTFNKFLSYHEPQQILNEVENDIASYLSKVEDANNNQESLRFFMPGQQFKYNEIKQIDQGAKEKLIEKKKNLELSKLTKYSGISSIFNQSPQTSRYERSNQKEHTQFSSSQNFETKSHSNCELSQPSKSQRELSTNANSNNKKNDTFYKILQSRNSLSTAKQLGYKQNQNPYLFENKNTQQQSQIDLIIQQQLEVKKNNYKPSPQIKEKTKLSKNPLSSVLNDKLGQLKSSQVINKSSVYNKSQDTIENIQSSIGQTTTTLLPGKRKAFHLNKIFQNYDLPNNSSSRNNSNKSRNGYYNIRYSKQAEDNEDLFHDTKEQNHSNSFASFTEIKLDQLYKQSSKIKTVIESSDQNDNNIQIKHQPHSDYKMEVQRNKHIKDLSITSREIQEMISRKFKQ